MHRERSEIAAEFDDIARFSGAADAGGKDATWVARQVPETAKRVLDVGCGAGGLARSLARPGRTITGIDLSPEMIRLARQYSSESHGASYEVADLMAWTPAGERYDAIVSVATLHHLDIKPTLERLSSWLRPGGRLVIVDLWRITSPLDIALSALAAPVARVRRFREARRARERREWMRAWDRHGARDEYLSMAEVRDVFPSVLPCCRVRRHLFWRYSVVWNKI